MSIMDDEQELDNRTNIFSDVHVLAEHLRTGRVRDEIAVSNEESSNKFEAWLANEADSLCKNIIEQRLSVKLLFFLHASDSCSGYELCSKYIGSDHIVNFWNVAAEAVGISEDVSDKIFSEEHFNDLINVAVSYILAKLMQDNSLEDLVKLNQHMLCK